MDSDQLSGAVGGRAVDARLPDIRYSGASTNVTVSSMGSSSALLNKDRMPSPPSADMMDEADIMPKRKTRRVRDPYALDLSDEEGEEAQRRPRQAPAQEESLVDFLNSVPPPPQTNPVLFDIPQTQNRQFPKKKASAPSLMARLVSRGSSSPTPASQGHNVRPRAPESRSLSSRAGGGRGYIPIQVNMPPGLDKYSPAVGSSSSLGQGSATPRPTGRISMRKFEPREAQPMPSRATSELADFFRNSEPP